MNLRIGLLGPSRIWQDLLSGEGVSFAVAEPGQNFLSDEWALLVVNRLPSGEVKHAVEAYLRSGGALLGSARHLSGVAGIDARERRLAFLHPDAHDRLSRCGLIDLNLNGLIPVEANTMRTQDDVFALFAGPLQGGHAVVLPFDVEEALADARPINKNFYARRERLPSERVSSVGKGEVQRLLRSCLQFLHAARGLPFAHLWLFPGGRRNLFAFRVDTDKSDREDIDALYAVATEFQAGMSWYLDVKSHEAWLDHFRFLSGQEIGLHCYEHEVYGDLETNLKNIIKAKRAMESAALQPQGFAAPYGKWNPSLGRALDELGFLYSSEFSFAYDALPMHPSTREFDGQALQVPIHPVCIGSLRRVGYTEEQMSRYFAMIVEQKLARHEPLFFYHHPVHKTWGVVRQLFADVRARGIESTTLGDFARWWIRRTATHLDLRHEPGILNAHAMREGAGREEDDLWLRIVNPSGEEAFVPCAENIRFEALHWEHPPPDQVPEDLVRIREFDPRRLLGDVYTTMIRRLK